MLPLNIDPYHITLIAIALITGVISPILVQLTKYYISNLRNTSNKKCNIAKNLKYEDLISVRIEKIREKYKADRVWILEFHNGSHTFSGKSFQKFSITYETVKHGVSREGPTSQNLPTSLFSRFFKTISDTGVFEVNDVTKVNSSNSSLQSFFESRGIKSFFALGIKNIENNIIGVMCLDSIMFPLNLDKENINDLKQDASILSGYLESI